MLKPTPLKALCLVVALLMPLTTVSPISETTVTACAIGGGVLSSAAAGYAIHSIAKSNGCSDTSTWLWTGLGSAATGFAVGALIYKIMGMYTPTGRFAYAQGVIATLSVDPIITKAGDSPDQIVARITSMHGTSWPLVAARETLMRQSVELGSASSALDAAYNEAIQRPADYPYILQRYQGLRTSIPNIYANIEHVLLVISKNEKYDLQVGLFEKHQAEIRQQQHEKTLQSSQQYHESWENYKERDYKRKENDKDRKLVASKPNAKLNFTMGGR